MNQEKINRFLRKYLKKRSPQTLTELENDWNDIKKGHQQNNNQKKRPVMLSFAIQKPPERKKTKIEAQSQLPRTKKPKMIKEEKKGKPQNKDLARIS